jgi:hypothetical protein
MMGTAVFWRALFIARQIENIDDKTRLSAGSGLMLERFSDAMRSAVNRSPAFERFVFSGFPACELRVDHDIRFKIERERSLVLETDVDEEILWGNVQFDALNDFASGLRERQNAPVGFLFGTLRDSHGSPFVRRGFVVRAAFWPIPERSLSELLA